MNTMTLSKLVLASTLACTMISAPVYADENEDLRNQVKALQDKVSQLEQQAAIQRSQREPSRTDSQTSNADVYDPWDPFQEMRMIERQMNQLMKANMVDFNPREDIKQTADHYIVSMDIPGMEKDKINVEVKSGMLIVSGERKSEVKEQKPNQFYRQERSFGHFLRTMPLPSDAKADHIEAKYTNGVLTVTVPREKASKEKKVGQKVVVK